MLIIAVVKPPAITDSGLVAAKENCGAVYNSPRMSESRVYTRRPQYTEAEIRANAAKLPGFDSPGNIKDIFTPYEDRYVWQSVLSVTVVSRLEGALHVLTGKRTAGGNATHVNVASTPTTRVPVPHASFFLVDDVPFCLNGEIKPSRPFVSKSLSPSVASLPESTDVLAAPVGSLLAAKLGLGCAMESASRPVGCTSLARCVAGFSYLADNDSGEPLYEPLVMFGAVVGLDPTVARQIPIETKSYSNLGWAPLAQYVRGVKTRSVLEVIPSASPDDELEVCVRGLCNATSLAIVSDPDEIQRHITEEGILPRL